MTSKHYVTLSLLVGGLSAVAFAGTGCGNGGTGGSGAAGGATSSSTHSSTTSSTTSTTVATGTGGAGGTMGGGNHSFDTANDIGLGAAATSATLQDPLTPDYYHFTGTKGDRIVIYGTAQGIVAGSTNLNDATVADTVVTIYDANKMPFAQDDDEWPRNSTDSQLFTELQATGDYYITIEDCNSYKATHNGVSCADPTGIKTLDYQIAVGKLNDTNAGTAQDGTAAKGVAVTYTGVTNMTGLYQDVVIDGNFQSTTDKHVFTFTPPANLKIDAAARPRGYFWVQPPLAVDGDGSTANVKVWVTDDAAGTHIIAEANQNNYTNGDDATNGPLEFSFPLAQTNATTIASTPYYLFVQNTATTSTPATDYYFILHGIGSINYGESETEAVNAKGTNDTMATAGTPLTVPGTDVGAYFVDAQLGAAGDVDWFSMMVPAMVTTSTGMGAPDHLEFDCDAARTGSGLTGFTAVLLASDGTTALSTIGPEVTPAKSDLRKGDAGDVALPATAAGKLAYFKISATGQDATNTGSYYHCNAFFFSTK